MTADRAIMNKQVLLGLGVVLVLVGGYFLKDRFVPRIEQDECDPARISQSFQPFDSLLQSFDDKLVIAFNVPPEMVVEPSMRMQDERRALANLEAPDCLQPLKAHMLDYMDGILNVLIAFMSGASPDQTRAALEVAQPMRIALEAELAGLLGATVTPLAMQAPRDEIIPVTGAETQATQPPAPTVSEVPSLSTVSNSKGANLRFGPSVNDSFQYVLEAGTVVELMGISQDGEWFLVRVPDFEDQQGWVFGPLLAGSPNITLLPIVASPEP
jgi:hypothetical protein